MSQSEKLNILFVAGWYPHPLKSLHHGIFIKRQAQAVALKHNVVLVTLVASDSNYVEVNKIGDSFMEYFIFYKRSNIILPFIKHWRAFHLLEKVFETEVYKIAIDHSIEIIHQHIAYPLGIYASTLAKSLKVPFVISEQWSGYLPQDNSYEKFPTKYFTKKVYKSANAITAVSSCLAKAIEDKGLTMNVQVVPNILDDIFLNSIVKQHVNDIVKIIHVSSLNDREKNISCLLKSLSLVKSKQLEFHVTIVGDSGERNDFEKMAMKFDINNEVTFVGTKTPEELVKLYVESDFFLLTSNFETFGVVLIEALACGLPIVATNVGAVPEIVNSSNGLLAQSNNANDIAEKIEMMSQNKNSYSKLILSESVKEKYSPLHISNAFSKIYSKVLNV